MKIFADSSLLIEFEKGAKTDLLKAILESKHQIFINPIVASEYLYQLLGILGGRSPMSISESRKIAETLETHHTEDFLSAFQILSIPDEAIPMAVRMMKKHNLLPNDALILASCKLQSVAVLASFDTDFSVACAVEDIRLISNLADFVGG